MPVPVVAYPQRRQKNVWENMLPQFIFQAGLKLMGHNLDMKLLEKKEKLDTIRQGTIGLRKQEAELQKRGDKEREKESKLLDEGYMRRDGLPQMGDRRVGGAYGVSEKYYYKPDFKPKTKKLDLGMGQAITMIEKEPGKWVEKKQQPLGSDFNQAYTSFLQANNYTPQQYPMHKYRQEHWLSPSGKITVAMRYKQIKSSFGAPKHPITGQLVQLDPKRQQPKLKNWVVQFYKLKSRRVFDTPVLLGLHDEIMAELNIDRVLTSNVDLAMESGATVPQIMRTINEWYRQQKQ